MITLKHSEEWTYEAELAVFVIVTSKPKVGILQLS